MIRNGRVDHAIDSATALAESPGSRARSLGDDGLDDIGWDCDEHWVRSGPVEVLEVKAGFDDVYRVVNPRNVPRVIVMRALRLDTGWRAVIGAELHARSFGRPR